MAKYANRKRREVTFKVRDQVLVSTKEFNLSQYSSRDNKALSPRYISPYTIIKQISPVTFRIRFPRHITMVPSFHASQLTPYNKSKWKMLYFTGHIPKLQNDPIQAILNRKYIVGLVHYLVLWKNGEKHWIPGRNLEDAHPLIIAWKDSL